MNKNAIKKFAMAARTRLIATVSDRAGLLGITKDKISQPKSKGNGFEIYETAAGTENTLNRNQIQQRRRLVEQIETRGFDVVMEEVAYTWFNRICAIRFMEVNDYLPARVRALSSLREGKNEPDLLTEAPNVDLDFTDQEREWILTAKEQNRLDELFSMLFIKQCNKLSEILPELFEATEDYTEMLLSLSYTNKDDVIRMLVDGVDEADFNVSTPDENGNPTGQVEIIGWLYQYYNTELKDDTFAQLKKNVKIGKERIPAATQLFTPDWIVRYMVENSVGRIWIEHLRAVDPSVDEKETAERFGWKYYLPEAEQEQEVSVKLAEIRKSYESLKPEDILCIDPCMGSGHIIVAQFDVLMDIYTSVGYGEREAAFEIVEHNLHGLDIDKRAYQLAYFAVMMKGRQYNRRFFRGKDGMLPKPKVYAFSESNDINRTHLKYLGADLNDLEKRNALNKMSDLLDTFKDAREYGSILVFDNYDWTLLRKLIQRDNVPDQLTLDAVGVEETKHFLSALLDISELLTRKYDVVVTNPPYMGAGGFSSKISNYVKTYYSDVMSDMFAVFMKRGLSLAKTNSFIAMVTPNAWLFLSSYIKLRSLLVSKGSIVTLSNLGLHAFDGGFGTAAWVYQKKLPIQYRGSYLPLDDLTISEEKERALQNPEKVYFASTNTFECFPNQVFAYWCSDAMATVFRTFPKVKDYYNLESGIKTGKNELFLRMWQEISIDTLCNTTIDEESLNSSSYRWFKCNKAGGYQKWYGTLEYVIKMGQNGRFLKNVVSKDVLRLRDVKNYGKEALTWPHIGDTRYSCKYLPADVLNDVAADAIYTTDGKADYYLIGLFNSCVFNYMLKMINPTVNYPLDSIGNAHFLIPDIGLRDKVERIVKENIAIAKADWDSFEASWDFQSHPLIITTNTITESYDRWREKCDERFEIIKRNEEAINQVFIKEFGLNEEMDPSVDNSDITIRRAQVDRDIRSLISYAVGCMFGRYSLDVEGLVYAGGTWHSNKYKTFIPDKDNIIPITDEEYFEDDIVGFFCEWLKTVYGADTLEENLDFIAKILGNKGDTSRDVIRNYFLTDFFKDHCNTYSVTGSGKRPIYWLFDSGKQNGFKALIYLHRYDQDTVGRVRMDYLHKTQKAIEHAMQSAQYTLDNSKSGTEKSKATKRIAKYTKQLAEIQLYDEAIAHVANQRIALDLDDGVKVNYAKFQGVEVAREGMKTVKVDLLAKI